MVKNLLRSLSYSRYNKMKMRLELPFKRVFDKRQLDANAF